MAELQCIVVTPETTVLDTAADFVALPLYDGEIGIAENHTPLIGRLGNGELRIREGEQTRNYYVEGGFVEVINNVVSVLTARALPAEAVDAEVAQQQLEAAQSQPARNPEQMAVRDRAISQARAQLRIVQRIGERGA
jgi:F-type H+-transporting ATPase subunit epsilon